MRLRRRGDASPRRIRVRRGRVPVRIVAALLIVAIAAGAGLAERRSRTSTLAAAGTAENLLLPLLDELDAVWSADRPDGPGPALITLLEEGRRPDGGDLEAWDAAHAALQLRLVGLDVAVPALGAQRQAVLAVTLSRDAVAVMSRAAVIRDASARDALAAEAVRLRGRGEQVAASALASIEELRTGRRRIAPPVTLPAPGEP